MTNRPQPAKILLIDDNDENLTLLRNLLEREGYRVVTANDSTNGLQQVRQMRPDLILSDLRMQGFDGFELTRRIRADKTLGFIPIILITSGRDNNDKIKALDSGADDFLVKPIQRLELSARVRSLLKLKQSNDELMKSREEYARLFQEAQQRAVELSTLNETALGISGQISLQELLQLIAIKSCELVHAQSAVVYLCDHESQTLSIHAEYNMPRSFLGETLRFEEGVAGWVAKYAMPMRQNNYFEWDGKAAAFAQDRDITAILGVPLINNNQVVGVLEVLNDMYIRVFNDEDVRLLNLLAPQASIAIRNALLYNEISRQHELVNSVLNAVDDGILMLDSEFRVALSNPRFTQLLKLEPAQVYGQTMRDVAIMLDEALESEPPFSAESMARILRELRRNPDHGFSRKVDIRDPRQRSIEWSAWPVRNQQRHIVGWLNVFHDTTQQRELEQLREDFIHMLVHDLRNPLTSVIGGIELASGTAEEDETDPQQKAFLMETIKKNSYVLLNMINELLEVNRMEAGKLPITLEEATLGELIESSLAQVVITAQDKRITLKKGLPEEETWINVDIEKMRRVIVNLISNSIKFSPSGLEIRIGATVEEGVRRRGNTSALDPNRLRQSTTQFLRDRYGENGPRPKALLLSISDDGPGIPADMVERIFDKFSQVPGQRREKQGFGLGLTWCKLVSEAHGGRVWVESQQGKGSTFFISIPCVIDHHQ
ncbi:MAG: response regulator [Chloroflexi bacterium]|nr:response regulator [Chloroflexota bacterium]